MTPLQNLKTEWDNCKKCPLFECRDKIVFGTGNPNADILLITDYPTETEDRLGHYNTSDLRWLIKAFKSAINKNKMPLKNAAHLFLERTYITSAVMCRPIHLKGDLVGESRDPKLKKEIRLCRDRLLEQIYLIDPKIIICAGKFASQALLDKSSGLPRRTGDISSLFQIEVDGKYIPIQYTCIPSPSPLLAERRGDYDDPDGFVNALCNAISVAWKVCDYLEVEDK